MANTHTPPYWRERMIQVLGGHPDTEKLRFLDAWSRAEGGNADWNPLNSTFPLFGATDYNSVGVKNYPRQAWGICALALTLTSPANGPLAYPKLLGRLQSAAGTYTAEQITNDCAAELKHWGSDPALITRILSQ